MTGKRILVADDSPTVLALLKESLAEEGYDVDTAIDGVDAIEHLYKQIPALVLLDIEMPRMNGYQVLRLIREDPLVKDLPVIFLTSKGEKGDRFWGLAVGADSYLVKDSDSWMLLGKIKDLLQNPPRPVNPRIGQPGGFGSTTPEALLERVNFLLDRKLFQATLSSELTSISRNPLALREVVNLLFQLLGRVCEFHLTHLLLTSGELMTCRAGAIGLDFASQADAGFRDTCTANNLRFEFKERMEFELADVAMRTRGIPRGVAATHEVYLRGRDGSVGLLFLTSGRENAFSEPTRETLEIFASGAGLALDAALRTRDLARLRQANESATKSLAASEKALEQVRGEAVLYRQLATALLTALKGAQPSLPELPDGCSQELLDLAVAIREATAR